MEEIKQDIMLNNKKGIKNILLKIFIILIAVVGLSLMSFVFIPVRYSVDLHLDNASKIELYQDNKKSTIFYKDENKEFKEIIEMFNETYSKDKLANALFTGKIANQEKIEHDKTGQSYKNIISNNKEVKYILLSYETEQQIMLNKKEYTSNELSPVSKVYKQVLIEINDATKLTESKIYYINSSGYTYFSVKFNTTGKTLYDYIAKIF